MLYLLTTQIFSLTPILLDGTPVMAGFTLTEVLTALGAITTGVGGILLRLLQRSDEKLQLRVDIMETDYKERISNLKSAIADVEKRITDDLEKDSVSRDKAISKIETRIEKLSDLIIKLIEKQ